MPAAEEHEEDLGISAAHPLRRISKRARRDKTVVVVFNEKDRREFVTGFHKRKKQRRKVAEVQKQVKARQKRLRERKERRLERGLKQGHGEGKMLSEDFNATAAKDATATEDLPNIVDSVRYEDVDMETIVKTTVVAPEDSICSRPVDCYPQVSKPSNPQVPKPLRAKGKSDGKVHKNSKKPRR